MRTRTLLLLAVAVGLLILVAGTIQLLRVDESALPKLSIGDEARAGDLIVTVLDATESDGTMRVEISARGVDDADGVADFALVGVGDVVRPQTGDGLCGELTVREQTCALEFDTTGMESDSRILRLERGEDVRRWVVG